jgi:hypothetical protein
MAGMTTLPQLRESPETAKLQLRDGDELADRLDEFPGVEVFWNANSRPELRASHPVMNNIRRGSRCASVPGVELFYLSAPLINDQLSMINLIAHRIPCKARD